jgi:hypothetical protein
VVHFFNETGVLQSSYRSFYYIFLILGETAESLLDGLGLRVKMQFVLNQFPRNSRHVSRLPCKDVPIFLEEFDEREFLFRVQIIAHVSDIGRLLRGQQGCFANQVLWLDGC